MWVLIAAGGVGVLGVWAILVTLAAGRYEGQHVLEDVQAEYDAWVAEQGSMILAEEHPLEPLPAPTVDPSPWEPDWREQTATDLAPEALDWEEKEAGELVFPAHGGWLSGPCLDDPGPGGGGSSLTPTPPPGPDHDDGSGWLEAQMADLFAWVREMHAVVLA